MSFVQNDPASCSGGNVVNKFSSRAQGDHSLYQQMQAGSQGGLQDRAPAFNKFSRADGTLQSEYEQFQRGQTQQGPSSQMGIVPQGMAHQGSQGMAPQRMGPPEAQQQPWISDFQRMHINSNQPALVGQQAVAGQWGQEFNGQTAVAHQAQNQDTFMVETQRLRGGLGMQHAATTGMFAQQHQTMESESVLAGDSGQKLAQHAAFDSEFAAVEQQLSTDDVTMDAERAEPSVAGQPQAQEQNVKPMDESDKVRFAQIAQSVFNTMNETTQGVSNETSDKFKNSNFLKLMDRISKREVEINDKKDKFIDSSGHDIRDDLPDPLRDLRGEDLQSGPYQSAKVVHERMGDHLQPSSWETSL